MVVMIVHPSGRSCCNLLQRISMSQDCTMKYGKKRSRRFFVWTRTATGYTFPFGFYWIIRAMECGGWWWWCNYSPTCSSSSSVLLFRSSSCLFFLFVVSIRLPLGQQNFDLVNFIRPRKCSAIRVAAYCFYTIELCRFLLVVIDFSVPPLSSRLCCLWPFPRRQEKNKRTHPFFTPRWCSGGGGCWVGRKKVELEWSAPSPSSCRLVL